jgi:acylglycerol lipase
LFSLYGNNLCISFLLYLLSNTLSFNFPVAMSSENSNNKVNEAVLIRGAECFVHHWKANDDDAPKALVVLFHGFLAHGNYPTVRYAAEFLVEAGYAVMAIDFPGHGRSEGLQGYLESAETVLADGVAMVEYAQTLYSPDLKLFLVGSSMGGAIALSVAQNLPEKMLAGVVLLAPMLKLNVSTIERSFLAGLAFVFPTMPLIPSSATDPAKQYRDPIKRKECQEDALTVSGANLRVASARTCVDITVHVQEQATSIKCPFLLMIADEDVVVKNEGSEALFSKAASTDKTKKHYPALHGLLCEPAPLFDEIKSDMLTWMAERT